MEASTSSSSVWRLVLPIGAPLAFAVTGLLHPFVAFYSAFDASVGLSGGLLARYVGEHPASRGQVSPAGEAVTDSRGLTRPGFVRR